METMNSNHTIGWIGTGRMGYAMAKRLVEAGCDVAIYNRTRSKAEPLAELGATIVDKPADLVLVERILKDREQGHVQAGAPL